MLAAMPAAVPLFESDIPTGMAERRDHDHGDNIKNMHFVINTGKFHFVDPCIVNRIRNIMHFKKNKSVFNIGAETF